MPIDVSPFRVREGHAVSLKKWPTRVEPFYRSKAEYTSLLAASIKELSARQSLLYAYDRYALLLIFQAMDGAGKDSVINHVMSGVNDGLRSVPGSHQHRARPVVRGTGRRQGERPSHRVAGHPRYV